MKLSQTFLRYNIENIGINQWDFVPLGLNILFKTGKYQNIDNKIKMTFVEKI